MNIATLRPANSREWSMVGIGAAAALVAFVLLTSRFEYRPMAGSDFTAPGVMRIDHWTGGLDRCIVSCVPVVDRPARPID
jgi:hypothetical protein